MRNVPIQRKHRLDLVAVPLDMIPQNSKLSHPLYLTISGRDVLFRNSGDELSRERAHRLKERVETVNIPREALKSLIEREAASLTPFQEYGQQQRNLLVAVSRDIELRRQADTEQVERMRRLAYSLASTLIKNPEAGKNLIRRYSDPQMYFVGHNINVMVYSVLMGAKLGLSPEALKLLAFGSLIHNIGNIFIPESILFKGGALSVSEWQQVQAHPMKGGRMIENMGASNEIVQMVEQHHERIDGRGYPYRLSGNRISVFARICSIADVFDALVSHRPYRKAVSPYEAVQIMREMVGKFDPMILRTISTSAPTL